MDGRSTLAHCCHQNVRNHCHRRLIVCDMQSACCVPTQGSSIDVSSDFTACRRKSIGSTPRRRKSIGSTPLLLVLMIFYGSPIGRACIVFLGLSTSVGVQGTVADAPTGLTVDALISGWFPFSLAPHTVCRCLYPSVDAFIRRVIVFSYDMPSKMVSNESMLENYGGLHINSLNHYIIIN